MEEIEVKFLDVDVSLLEKKLCSIGAEKIDIYDYERVLLDYPDFRMDKSNTWLRLRTNGKESTLTYKRRLGVKSDDGSVSDEGMKEIEVSVGDYQKAYELFKAVGFVVKREEKNKRISYKKGVVVFDIDFWPHIPPYLEIESISIEEVHNAARELGFDPKSGLICSPKQIYKKYGIDIDEYSYVSFEKMMKK